MAAPINFQESTNLLHPTQADDGSVEPLPVLHETHGEVHIRHSVWKLTPEEQQRIAVEGLIILSVYGGHPPVAISIPERGLVTPIEVRKEEEVSA